MSDTAERKPHLHIDPQPGLHAALLAMGYAAKEQDTREPQLHRAHPKKRTQRRQVRASRKANR